LQTLWARGHVKFDGLTIVERLVSVSLDGGEMDKNVLATLALDKSKTLARIEPLYSSLFFHFCFSFLFKLFGVLSFSRK
jgi:hypothetical protein